MALIQSPFQKKPIWRVWILLMAFFLMFGPLGPCIVAQPTTQPPNKQPDVIPLGILPDIYLYRNEDGEWVQVFQEEAREYQNFLKSRTEPIASQFLPKRLEGLSFDLRLEGKHAKISGTVTALLEEDSANWFEIPISLSTIQILPGEQKNYSRIVPASGSGYAWRHGPTKAGKLDLTFEAVTNITPSTEGGSIRLELPNARSRIKLPLSPDEWDVAVAGAMTDSIEPNPQEKLYFVNLLGGTVDLSWTRKASTDNAQTTEANSVMRVSVDLLKKEYAVTNRVTIRGPRRLGGRSFSFQLPTDCEWSSRTTGNKSFPGYRLALSDDPTSSNLILKVEESVVQSEIEVLLEWVGKITDESNRISISLQHVEGVRHHAGQINLVLGRSQSFLWEPQKGVLFTRANGDVTDSAATHSFTIQKESTPLNGRLVSERRIPSIRADYRLRVVADRIIMTSVVEFREDLRSLPLLQWESQGWILNNATVLSSGKQLLVNSNSTSTTSNEPTVLPLTYADLSDGTEATTSNASIAETGVGKRVLFQCYRNWDSATIEVDLPQLSWLDETKQERDVLSPPGTTRIESSIVRLRTLDDFTSIVPMTNGPSESLLSDVRVPAMSFGDTRSTLVLSRSGAMSKQTCRFAAEPLPPDIEMNETIQIRQGRSISSIDQEWLLRIKGSFPAVLSLAIPTNWFHQESQEQSVTNSVSPIELNLNGIELNNWTYCDDKDTQTLVARYPMLQSTHRWIKVPIPESSRSQIAEDAPSSLSVRPTQLVSKLPKEKSRIEQGFAFLEAGGTVSWIRRQGCVCLVFSEPDTKLLVEDYVLSQRMSEIRIGNDIWMQTRLDLPLDATRLSATVIPTQGLRAGEVKTERAWVQSIVQADTLRHRVVLRFRTNLSSISLRLPPGFRKEMELTIGGAKTDWLASPNEANVILVDLNRSSPAESLTGSPSDQNAGETEKTYVLEMYSWQRFGGVFWRTLSMPHIEVLEQFSSKTPVVWQILSTPADYLLASSETLAPQNHWSWSSLWLHRRDPRGQESFEKEIGASIQPVLEVDLNQNTIATIDSSQPRWVRLVPKYLVWLPVGLLTLVASLSVFHVRWLRNPILLVVYLILLVGLFQWWFDGAVILMQSALMAATVSLCAMLLAWVLDRNSRRRTIFAGRGTTVGSLSHRPMQKPDSKIESNGNVSNRDANNSLPTTIAPQDEVLMGPAGTNFEDSASDGSRGGSGVQGAPR